jgi:hypothetical protein
MKPQFHAIPTALAVSLLFLGCAEGRDGAHFDSSAGPLAPSFSSQGAGPPLTGSGSGMITALEITSSRNAGPNVIQERYIEATIEGALEGTFVQQTKGVIHGNGLITFQGTMEFTGTVAGCGEGTLTAALSGTGQAGVPVTDAKFRVINQASGTLGVAGTGSMHQVGPAFTYEVRYVCR